MLTIYGFDNKNLVPRDTSQGEQVLRDALWIDLNSPTLEEESAIEKLLGIDIPTQDEMAALELSNRLYKENGAFFFTITLLTHAQSEEPENKPYTFVLTDRQLITVRYADTQPFRVTCDRLQKAGLLPEANPKLIALSLLEAIVNRLADVLEQNGKVIDGISKNIFRARELKVSKSNIKEDVTLQDIIRETGIEGDLLSKVKESLVSLNRLLSFAKQSDFLPKDSEEEHRIKIVALDVTALSEHATFLANKVTFLLDATLGLIAIQQNGIIKIFSVAAVIFLPPTLVASIYGMNFRHMPELNFEYGYPLAIFIIVLAAYLPYRFFKFKNWL